MTIVTLGLDRSENWVHMVGFDVEGRIELTAGSETIAAARSTSTCRACLIGMRHASRGCIIWARTGGAGATARPCRCNTSSPSSRPTRIDYRDAGAQGRGG